MRGRHLRHHARGDLRIARHQGAHQAALAARGQRQRFVDIVVAHHGADGAERFHVMHGVVAEGVAAQQQGRREEAAILCPIAQGIETVGCAKYHLVTLRQGGHPFRHVVLLFLRCQRAHAHAFDGRIAHHHLGQALAQVRADGIHQVLGHDDAANRRALLARLARHFAHHFLDEQVKFHIIGRDVRRQDGAVERIGFAVERH